MDALSDVLRLLRLSGAVYLNGDFTAHGWTVDELARRVCLPRSGSHLIAVVAERVGYKSEAAFNRAFKRQFGLPPAAWRRSRGKLLSEGSLSEEIVARIAPTGEGNTLRIWDESG